MRRGVETALGDPAEPLFNLSDEILFRVREQLDDLLRLAVGVTAQSDLVPQDAVAELGGGVQAASTSNSSHQTSHLLPSRQYVTS